MSAPPQDAEPPKNHTDSWFPHLIASLLLLLQVTTNGCKVGPDYHRPAALGTNSMPAQYLETAGTNNTDWKLASPSAHLPRGAWWEVFGDTELNQLETLNSANNPELAAA